MKAYFKDGMLFEEFGFRYFGPVDGHDLPKLRRILRDLKTQKGPILLHVFTEKGHGVPQASADPVVYHTPPVFAKVGPQRTSIELKRGGSKAYTDAMSAAIQKAMAENKKVTVLTAAMCQGNKLERARLDFPDRFFDVGICESHAVAFAAGLAKTGTRPICDIYSTFLQRSFDQIFQEVALLNLPVVFTLDRAGLTGPDGPTHHGVFDIAYMRLFPNLTVMAPGDEHDIAPMLQFALGAQNGPVSMRYPGRRASNRWSRDVAALDRTWPCRDCRLGRGRHVRCLWHAAPRGRPGGQDVARRRPRRRRHQRPLRQAARQGDDPARRGATAVCHHGRRGNARRRLPRNAVLEAANAAGLDARNITRLGLPDRFVEHAERGELLAELGLDAKGLCRSRPSGAGKRP